MCVIVPTKGQVGLCCLMTPGLTKDIRCHVWPYLFKTCKSHHHYTIMRHQATPTKGQIKYHASIYIWLGTKRILRCYNTNTTSQLWPFKSAWIDMSHLYNTDIGSVWILDMTVNLYRETLHENGPIIRAVGAKYISSIADKPSVSYCEPKIHDLWPLATYMYNAMLYIYRRVLRMLQCRVYLS